MAGPSIQPNLITTANNKIYSHSFTFSGGGTQTVLTPARGESWLLYSAYQDYGSPDDRHGQFVIVGRTIYGADYTNLQLIASMSSPGTFSLSGSNVQYYAGGGNPFTSIWMLRLF